MSTSVQVSLFVAALAVIGVLTWLKLWPKVRALLALFIGTNIGGWAAGWLATAVGWVSDWVGSLLAKVFGVSADAASAAVPAALGLTLLIIFVVHMWPKKGKATGLTAAAAFVLPLLWPALTAGLEQVSPGITGGV